MAQRAPSAIRDGLGARGTYRDGMHPRQSELPPEIQEVWLAALADAEIDPNDALLYLLEGTEGSNGYGAQYLYRGLRINAEGEAGEIHPLLDEMNDDTCIDAYRIVVFRERSIEGIAALIRHELEHAPSTTHTDNVSWSSTGSLRTSFRSASAA
jgi:hypothetical protein